MGTSKLPWTPEDDAVVRENYPTHGMKWDGWAQVLPGRTEQAISRRACSMGVKCVAPKKRNTSWTAEEDETLRRYFPTHGPRWDGWVDHLPDRSAGQIKSRAYVLKLRVVVSPSKPKASTPHLGSKCAAWTDAEREELLLRAKDMVRGTSHPIGECMVELALLDEPREKSAA